MKILFTRFPLTAIPGGGAEVQIERVFNGLKKVGHDVYFLGSCPALLNALQPNIGLDVGPPPVTKTRMFSLYKDRQGVANKLTDNIKQQKPDVIVMHSITEKLLLTPYCVKHNIKVIWVEHDPVGRWLTSNVWLPRLKKLSKQVTTVVVSGLSKQIFVDLGWPAKQVECIANGIELTETTPEHYPKPTNAPWHVGCIARLEHEKGVDLLLEAINNIDNITLTIVGRGSQQKSLLKQAKLLNSNRVRAQFIDRLPSLNDFWQSIDCFVLPSRSHDPFGLVVAEAMVHGVPTVITNKCGIAGFLEHEQHSIVCQPDELKKGILQLKQNPLLQQKLKQNGRKLAEELFSIEGMIKNYEKILATSPEFNNEVEHLE